MDVLVLCECWNFLQRGHHKMKSKKVFGKERFEKFVHNDIDLDEFAVEMVKTRGWRTRTRMMTIQ